MSMLTAVALFLRAMLTAKIHLAVENLALRQQLAVCRQSRQAPEAAATRSRLLGVAVEALAELAICPGHRPARNGCQMAPEGLQAFLAMEVEGRETRTPAHRTRTP